MGKFTLDQGFGGEQWIRRVALHLAKSNEITVLTSDRGPRNVDFHKELSTHVRIRAIEVAWKERSKFADALKENLGSFDCIYVLDSPFGNSDMGRILKLYSDARFIKGNHTPLSVKGNLPRLPFLTLFYFGWIKPLLLRSYNQYSLQHVLNRNDLEYCEAKYLPARLIYNGIELEENPTQKFEKFTILVVGRMNFQKGTMHIIEVLEKLQIQREQFDLIVIGDGTLRKKLEKRAGNRAKIKGFVEESEKTEYIKRSHVVLVPSRWEVFPFTVVESLSLGTPVVSFDIAGVRDIIENSRNGFLCANVDTMVEKLEYIHKIFTGEEYEILSKNSIESVQMLRWNLILPAIENMVTGHENAEETLN